jgi:hypothetical protein
MAFVLSQDNGALFSNATRERTKYRAMKPAETNINKDYSAALFTL